MEHSRELDPSTTPALCSELRFAGVCRGDRDSAVPGERHHGSDAMSGWCLHLEAPH